MEYRNRTRLVIADDHTLVAEACKSVLEPEFEVVAIVEDGRALLRAAAELKPHVLIVDIAMPLLNGLDAGEQAKKALPAAKLLYLTMNTNPELVAEAFRRGASGYVPKNAAATELIVAVRDILRGKPYLSPLIDKDAVTFLRRSCKEYVESKQITQRQTEVLQLLAEGYSMKEIAYTLNVKSGTVAFHKYRIMDALGIKTTADLLRYAIRNNLIAA